MATEPAPQLLREFTLTRRVVVNWTCLGTGVGLVALVGFAALSAVATTRTTVEVLLVVRDSFVDASTLTLLLVVGVTVLHEAIHAAVIRYYGGDVSFGVGLAHFVLPYAYVTTTKPLQRNQFLVVALAPLVVITLVGTPVMVALESSLLVFPLTFNVAGAVGDVWMVGLLLRHPPNVIVEDSKTGLKIYATVEDGTTPPATRAPL